MEAAQAGPHNGDGSSGGDCTLPGLCNGRTESVAGELPPSLIHLQLLSNICKIFITKRPIELSEKF
jgi:hypothetical protein